MSFIDPSVKPSLKEQFSLEHAKKAYGAGATAAIAAVGTVSLSGIFADGKIDGPELLGIGGAIVGGFVFGFFGAWLPAQPATPPKGIPAEPSSVLTPDDGLGA